MHLGYSLNLGGNYDWRKAFSVGLLFQYCDYSISQYKSDLTFTDPMPGGPNFTYDLQLRRTLRSFRFGLGSTLFIDQINPKTAFSRVNYGIYFDFFHGVGKYQNDRTSFQWGQGDGNLTRTTYDFNYTNLRYGLAIALNFKSHQGIKLLWKTGVQHTLRSYLNAHTSNGQQDIETDFTGAHTSLALRFYFKE